MATGYYVTLIRESRNGPRTAWLLGPFREHDDAKQAVREAHEKAQEIDPATFWDSFGTSSITTERALPPGKLNSLLPHLLDGKGLEA